MAARLLAKIAGSLEDAMNASAIGVSLSLLLTLPQAAVAFSSGSTGANGALDLAGMECTECWVALPPSGVLNYTTVNVPSGKWLRFVPNAKNTPVAILAQGSVTIAGSIDVSANATWTQVDPNHYNAANTRLPGPGGFYGGAVDQYGFGPGGGAVNTGATWAGPIALVPLVGGSGGGGQNSDPNGGCLRLPGSGGGGAILLASSGAISISGNIQATGGSYNSYNGWCFFSSPGGSGGSIRIVGTSVFVAGGLDASSGGVIRLEAPQGALTFTGSANPPAVLTEPNPVLFAAAPPTIAILSVGGYPVPANSGQRFDTADLILPAQLPDPIDVVVAASNVPVGNEVGIKFGTSSGGVVTTGMLAGTLAASTATIQVSGLDRGKLAYFYASTTFAAASASAESLGEGADAVASVRATAGLGGETQFTFLRSDGSEIEASNVPADLLRKFGRD